MYEKLIVAKHRTWIALLSALGLATVHQYLFYGHSVGISYPVFVILFYLYMYTYAGDKLRAGSWFSRFAMTVIILLSMTYGLFSSAVFMILNALIIPCLIALHLSYMLSRRKLSWYQPMLLIDALDYLVPQAVRHWITPFRLLKNTATRKMESEQKRVLTKVLIGLVIALPLLLIIVSLLTSADRIFEQLISTLPNWIDELSFGEGSVRLLWIGIGGLLFFGYLWGFVQPYIYPPVADYRSNDRQQPRSSSSYLLSSAMTQATASTISPTVTPVYGPHPLSAYDVERKPLRIDPIIMATILILINIVYVLFVVVQFSYLFGAGQGQIPDGSSYAEYARSGFVELVFVTMLNFIIMMCVLVYMAEGHRVLKHINNSMLYILVICSGVMLYSAFTRLIVYEQAYGYTYTRFLVHAFMIFLGVLLLVAGLRISWKRLPLAKCYIVLALTAYVVVNYVGMDRMIVVKNLDRYEQTGRIDHEYLSRLSSDAVPILLKRSAELSPMYHEYFHRLWANSFVEDLPWQSINWANYKALRALRKDEIPL